MGALTPPMKELIDLLLLPRSPPSLSLAGWLAGWLPLHNVAISPAYKLSTWLIKLETFLNPFTHPPTPAPPPLRGGGGEDYNAHTHTKAHAKKGGT